ncbi:hypothetical protein N4239_12315 [Brachyspira hyodysenteriae]|uniref:hypothetical protein n=1 Tax=Brachyspira hyodysenteriae TaxID=159 RepID=UPI002B25EB1C|nr:hypothetical protein [Brachyspira hyodysenteriae]WPC23718.1 hypothetical protein N4239_12315 [Brachyspira hyodysenteriae]
MKLKLQIGFITLIAFTLISCGGLPVKEYERVTALRDTVVNKYPEIQTFAQEDFDIAEKGYAEADIIMKEENKDEAEKAKELLLAAETNYNLVLDKGLPPYSEILKKQTDESATNAIDIKASVMYADEFSKADTVYQEANAMYTAETKDYRIMVDKLYQAKVAYTDLYNKTKEQFDRSDEALKLVKERLAQLEKMMQEIEAFEQEQN